VESNSLGSVSQFELLPSDWQIVLVVTEHDIANLSATLDDLKAKSLATKFSIFATDNTLVREALASFAAPVEFVLPDETLHNNFWSTLIPTLPRSHAKLLIVRAGVHLPQHWDARLVAAGIRLPQAAVVFPLNTSSSCCALFSEKDYVPQLDVECIDQWLNDYVSQEEYQSEFTIPALAHHCALLQNSGLWEVDRHVNNDAALQDAFRHRGLQLAATRQLYVDDSALTLADSIESMPRATIDAYSLRSPIASLRHAIAELDARAEAPPALVSCLPVQLHVGHSWGGGLGRWIEDYVAADKRHNHLILRSVGDLTAFGQTISLYRSAAMDIPIRSWTLVEPIVSISGGSLEYRSILSELVKFYGVESIVVSSLIGHSLDLLDTGLPTTVVLHDFFPVCPALYATFGAPCTSCTKSELSLCLKDNPRNSFFKFESNEHWDSIRNQFRQKIGGLHTTLVAPSESVIERYSALTPALNSRKVHLIPHGLSIDLAQSLEPANDVTKRDSDRLRIVILGRLTPEKGGDLLEQLIPELSRRYDVFLLGTGEGGAAFESLANVSVVTSYEKYDLGALLREIRPDIGVLASTVPETFSYTLSELWAAAIPVVATRLGAFENRVVDNENGWLVEAALDQFVDTVEKLSMDRATIARVSGNLRQQAVRTTKMMVDDYFQLELASEGIPIGRYFLPRRSYRNPYTQGIGSGQVQALYFNPQQPYAAALREFLLYTGRKVETSPRLPARLRSLIARCIRQSSKWIS